MLTTSPVIRPARTPAPTAGAERRSPARRCRRGQRRGDDASNEACAPSVMSHAPVRFSSSSSSRAELGTFGGRQLHRGALGRARPRVIPAAVRIFVVQIVRGTARRRPSAAVRLDVIDVQRAVASVCGRRRVWRSSSRRSPAPSGSAATSVASSTPMHDHESAAALQAAMRTGRHPASRLARGSFGTHRVAHARARSAPRTAATVRVRPRLSRKRPARSQSSSGAPRSSGMLECVSHASRRQRRRGGRRIRFVQVCVIGRILVEQLLQVRQRVKEVRLHRADRAAEDPGDLLVRQVVIHAQDQRRALLLGSRAIAARTLGGALRSQQRRIRRSPRACRACSRACSGSITAAS